MAPQTINVLLSSFPGLSLPPTLSIPLPSTSTVGDLIDAVSSFLPASLNPRHADLVLTTLNNKNILPQPGALLSSLLPVSRENVATAPSTLLPVRLSVPIRGGKGGFGSQLRAAGGRMSSKRKRNQGENNGSNRNLDGRRIRTVNEAKALAEYLALKPDMDRKEKEERRKRWEMVVEAAERREEEVRNGGGAGKSRGKVDGAWMEDKEEMGEKARDAVLRAMSDGIWKDNLGGATVGGSSTSSAGEGSGSGSPMSSEESDEEMDDSVEADTTSKGKAPATVTRRYIGFDDDDEFMSSDEDEAAEEPEGKGKGRA